MRLYFDERTGMLNVLLVFFIAGICVISQAATSTTTESPLLDAESEACEFCHAITTVPAGVSLTEVQEDCLAFFAMYPEALDIFDSVYIPPPMDSQIVNDLSVVLSGSTRGINSHIPESLVPSGTLVIFPSNFESISLGHPVGLISSNRGYYRNTRHGSLKVRPKSSFSRTSVQQAEALFSIQRSIQNLYFHGLELVNQNDVGSTLSGNARSLLQTTSSHQVENLILDNVELGNNTVERRENFSQNRINVTGRVSMKGFTMNCDSLISGQRCLFIECSANCGNSFVTLSDASFSMGVTDSDSRDVFGMSLVGLNSYRIYNVSLNAVSVPNSPHLIRLFSTLNLASSQPGTVRCASDINIMPSSDRINVGIGQQASGTCFDTSLMPPTPFFCPMPTTVSPAMTSSPASVTSEGAVVTSPVDEAPASSATQALTNSLTSLMLTPLPTSLPTTSSQPVTVSTTPVVTSATTEPATTTMKATTEVATEVTTKPAATTEDATTEELTTKTVTTDELTTEKPTTEALTTEELTTQTPSTEAPVTEALTTEETTSTEPTTEALTTEALTTEAHTTEPPTTKATTPEVTSAKPTTPVAVTTEDDSEDINPSFSSPAYTASDDSMSTSAIAANMSLAPSQTSSVKLQTAGLSTPSSSVSQLIPASSESAGLDLTSMPMASTTRFSPSTTAVTLPGPDMPTDGSNGGVTAAWIAGAVVITVTIAAIVGIAGVIAYKHWQASHTGSYQFPEAGVSVDNKVDVIELSAPIVKMGRSEL